MTVFIITFIIFLCVVAMMAVGVIFSNIRVKGSCGGLGAIDGAESSCSCKTPCEKRKQKMLAQQKALNQIDIVNK